LRDAFLGKRMTFVSRSGFEALREQRSEGWNYWDEITLYSPSCSKNPLCRFSLLTLRILFDKALWLALWLFAHSGF
jgi:hypothetical protein